MQVQHWDNQRDGPLSEAAMRRKLEERGYSVSRYVYPPGTYFPERSISDARLGSKATKACAAADRRSGPTVMVVSGYSQGYDAYAHRSL